MTPDQLQEDFYKAVRSSPLGAIAQELGVPLVPKNHTDSVLAQLLTTCPVLEDIKAEVRKLANTPLPILILGQTGTGKELIAKALHGSRPSGNFIPVNCGAIPPDLLESELFGSVKGAYTGATDRVGLVEEAHGGTLFLDEIGDMPLLLQCKLLRVLNDKKYRKVGSTAQVAVDFRVVSATNHLNLLTTGFRADLYYRLAGHVIKLPTLRERPPADIALIAAAYAKSPPIAELVVNSTKGLDLEGNVRELLNIINRHNYLIC